MALTRSETSDILKLTFKAVLHVFLAAYLVRGHNQIREVEPEFLAELENFTVAQGRDVVFTCVVNNLGQYRVAWIKSDSKAILAIHTHMVALNPRISVTHNGHNTWKLHITHVQQNDSGSYMCQVNTDPMKSQSGYLDVVVPPDILNPPDRSRAALEDGTSNEGGTIELVCSATGVPGPTVIWRREGGKEIILRNEVREKQSVKMVEGERLILNHVQRSDMGGYLCIASNGVPPSVSKRFDVRVNFPPSIKAVNQLVGAPVDSQVLLQCIVEVYPKALNGWYRNEGSVKLHDGQKYSIAEMMLNQYTWQMNLTIRQLQSTDFGTYSCSSVNALGKNDARIRLQGLHNLSLTQSSKSSVDDRMIAESEELEDDYSNNLELRLAPSPTTTTPLPTIPNTTPKPRRKQVIPNHNHNKGLNEVVRSKEAAITNHIQDTEYVGNIPEVFTHIPAKNNLEKSRDNQVAAAVVPSRQPPPWIFHSGSTSIQTCVSLTTFSITLTFLFLSISKHILNEITLT